MEEKYDDVNHLSGIIMPCHTLHKRRAPDFAFVDHVRLLAAYTSAVVARPHRLIGSILLRPVTTFLCTPNKRAATMFIIAT
jgi:hypothetical protein